MMPGMPERRTHDSERNGITSLFAAFNIADGSVIGELHRQHRAAECTQFLTTIDKTVPPALEVHVICDNYGTHKTPAIKAWLGRHPRFHLPFTPTGSSWINQVERWFGFLTDQLLQRGVKGAQTRSCSSPVLAEQTAEQVTPTHPALPILADDAQPGAWVWRCKPEGPVGTVAVVMLDVDPEDLLQVAAADDQ
jgi:hypothetical protein